LNEVTNEQLASAVIRQVQSRRTAPLATYRLQFNGQFTLLDGAAIAPYLADLGVSHVYASPYWRARPGSGHGYDVCDPTAINPELGGDAGHAALVAALRQVGLSHILDVVPNHMSATSFNPWWMDVLENGPSSPYSGFFDVDWVPVKDELAHKVLLPILGQQYGEVLESGQLMLVHSDGGFFVRYFEHTLPLGPRSTLPLLGHHLEELRIALGPTSDECLEYESILTSIENLPPQNESHPDSVAIRQREKEVIKRRLRDLEARAPMVSEAIARSVAVWNGVCGDSSSFDRLDSLLQAQAYRLCYWRAASDEINYRRFFDINELAAVCTEAPEVFRRVHELVARLLAAGTVEGLRIDHIDGLYAPEAYLFRLQWMYLVELIRAEMQTHRALVSPDRAASESMPPELPASREIADVLGQICDQLGLPRPQADDLTAVLGLDANGPSATDQSGTQASLDQLLDAADKTAVGSDAIARSPIPEAPLYVVVEKILGPDEPLPESWPTAGTSGYDFLKALGGLLIDHDGAQEIKRNYDRFVGETMDFEAIAYACKQQILRVSMASELQMLAHRLNRISEQHRRTRDFTLNSLRYALREILANFPVYRTYPGPAGVSERDRRFVQHAVARAKRRNPAIDFAVFDFIREVLLLEHPAGLSPLEIAERDTFAGRFQQVTSPVMAKGVEDTTFYVYCPLISANEVGGEPRSPACSIADFHRENAARQADNPLALLATSTHDTKRSEDVRARISVLSEIPGRWKQAVNRWARSNRRHLHEVDGLPAPSRNDEYVFYQTLVGVWPLTPPDESQLQTLTARLQQYMEKATREAKQRTSWVNPNAAYDQAVRAFVAAALEPGKKNRFLADFREFHEQVVDFGLYSALSQTVLKLTSSGVPDIYQGQELWDFSLVDPDNRRPVDYAKRRWLLGEIQAADADPQSRRDLAQHLAATPRDSRLKLLATWRLLNLRRSEPDLFQRGEYLPLEIGGEPNPHLVAFARRLARPGREAKVMLVVVPRFFAQLLKDHAPDAGPSLFPFPDRVWGGASVQLPPEIPGSLTNLFTGEKHSAAAGTITAAELFREFPVAVLVSD
jgi:(1->4)-alpha-D-glucan 1-alpha-D-glucosylmutase